MTVDWARTIRPPLTGGLEAAIGELIQSIRNGLERHSQYQTFQAPEEIPLDIRKRPLHPDNPADTDWAIIFRHEFKTAGYAGLTRALEQQAKLHQSDKRVSMTANYKIMDDQYSIHFMMILATMYPGFIEGLIDGDLCYKYAQKDDVRRAFDLHHSLSKTPGNYLQGFIQRNTLPKVPSADYTGSTQADQRVDNPHRGKGLTFANLLNVYHTAAQYLPSSRNKDMTVVHTVDEIFPPRLKNADYRNGQHKYVQRRQGPKEPGNEEKYNTWLDELNKVYITRICDIQRQNPQDPILDIPMRTSLLEIGWGSDALARSSAHDDHTSSNKLWTFWQALVKNCTDTEHGEIFTVERFATNLLTRGDSIDDAVLDARLADVGITMIGHTEWFNAGLNPAPGGGGGVQPKSLSTRLEYIKDQAEKTYAGDHSRFKRSVIQDRKKIADLKKVESMTEQEFVRREKEVELTRRKLQRRWEAVQNELRDLEDVKTLYIAEDLARLGKLSADKAQRSEKSALDTSGMSLKHPMKLRAENVEEEEDIAEDVGEAAEDMKIINEIDDIFREMMDEEDEPIVLQPEGFLSGEQDIMRSPDSSSVEEEEDDD